MPSAENDRTFFTSKRYSYSDQSMIFGFNTDVKVGSVVYHVQSEARQKDSRLQTQVFVKGRCIGKCSNPFPEEPVLLDFAEDSIQQALKLQHRRIVDAVRAGSLLQELDFVATSLPDQTAASAPAGGGLAPVFELPPTQAGTAAQPDSTHENEQLPASLSAPVSGFAASVHPSAIRPGEPLVASPEGLTTGSLKIECTGANWVDHEQSLLLVLQVHREHTPVDYAALTLRLACGAGRPRYAYSSTDGNGIAAVSISLEDASGREGRLLVQAESEGESATRRFRLHPTT
jgi:hypothetical protein